MTTAQSRDDSSPLRNDRFDLKPQLLDGALSSIESPTALRACINAHGLYDSFQFVLRLSPEVHRRIAAMPSGIVSSGSLSFDGVQAFSTYLHETIHWWQHVGSTIGLMLSLSYPAQAHANHLSLKTLVGLVGAKKSIRRWMESCLDPGGDPETPAGLGNLILNNHFDIEFFRILANNPPAIREVVNDPLFYCTGHSYATAYGQVLFTLSATLGDDFKVIPNPELWRDEFRRLRSEKVTGYYYGSDIRVAPLGARAIFEGQARFSQLQYLCFASGGRIGWDDARAVGMLTHDYVNAFQTFLGFAELEWPPSIDHSVVALFLLVCDIALNPNAGFPAQLRSFKTFIEDIDPGIRFVLLSRMIATKVPETATAIQEYSRNEYLEVSDELTRFALYDHPLAVGAELKNWTTQSENLQSLMNEYRTFGYSPVNLPLRMMFSHFIAFNRDKMAKPEYFCWPGAWMAGERVSLEIQTLFTRHSALFVDKENDDRVFPRILPDRDEKLVYKAFHDFYSANVTYDMARQWIATDGPFQYDYSWLSTSGTRAELKDFADRHFKSAFDVWPDSFEVL